MIIRNEALSDAQAVRDLVTSAFKDKPYSSGAEPFIMEALRERGAATVALVAEDGGAIVGQIVFSPITIGGRSSDWHCLGPVAARPDRQRQGIGRSLIERGLERLREIGSAGCVLVGDPAYYSRFGFRRSCKLRAPDLPAEYFMILPFAGAVPSGTVGFHAGFSAKP